MKVEHQCSPRLGIKFWPSPRFEVEEEKILCWENRAPVLPQMDFSQVPDLVQNKKAEVLLQGKTSAFFIWPAAVSNNVNHATFSKITKSCQKSPKTDKNRQKLTKIHKNHQTIDKNCTVGQKIELWSHCAPAKSPKIVKNRQKRQKNAQWDGKSWKIELWSHCAPHCTSCSSAVVLASSSSHCAAVLFLI